MTEKKYKNMKDFYPFYLGEHSNRICRGLHFIGTLIMLIMLLSIVISSKWQYLWSLPIVAYGFAWIGHFVFEKNRPATFTYPLLSLRSDFVMFWQILTGKISF